MFSVLLACMLLAIDPPPVDAVIVAPREFLPALQPLVDHRQQQGHRFAYLSNGGSAAEIRAGIRRIAAGGQLKYVLIVAGVGGFSPLLDTVIETATSKLLTSGIPAAYDTRMTYGGWRSPYCPDPRLFHAMTVERHNEGCLFWVYIGHGQATELDRVSIPGERFHIFDVNDCRELQCKSGAPIAVMLACYTAAFDQPQDCLAEQLL